MTRRETRLQISEVDKAEAVASLLAIAVTVLCDEKQAEDLISQPEKLMHYLEGIKRLDLKTKSLIAAIFAGEVAETLIQKSRGFGKKP